MSLLPLFLSVPAFAGDPDLPYIVDAVKKTPCAELQVLIAKNIGVIRWQGGSMRYLYEDDIAPLRDAQVSSGKLPIDVDQTFDIPNTQDPNWPDVEDRLFKALNAIFDSHPNSSCPKS
jgi:hypothetical protein